MVDAHDRLSDFRLPAYAVQRPEPLTVLFAPSRRRPVADLSGLTSIVEREVVPRLCRATSVPKLLPSEISLADQVADLTDHVLGDDLSAVHDQIERLRREGFPLERIFLEVLAPMAARLRDLWADDHCGFAEVTLAMVRLQSLVRHFAASFRAESRDGARPARESGRRAMIVAPRIDPDIGATMFGLVMLAEFFRRGGWEPWLETDFAGSAFASAISGQWFDVAEVLVQGDGQLDGAADGIRAIRRGSLNRAIVVVVCGPASLECPDLARLVGADLASSDPRTTFIQAQQYVSLGDVSNSLR
jgi:MerR family transcriptional regulator, light-induced transcriptional regulator